MDKIFRMIDTAIYGLIGPFAALHILPRYFLGMERAWHIDLTRLFMARQIGSILMTSGAALALYCTVLMYLHNKGSISPFLRPTALVSSGPYRLVRHPMMWALNLVLIGEVLTFSSLLIFLWLLLWARFSALYIDRYEEPYLRSVFGDDYIEYCRVTPRWIPRLSERRSVDEETGAT